MIIIAPSILSADFGHLAAAIAMLNESSADWIHMDIMDGVFVPNISFGMPVVQAVSRLTSKPLDAHLMIVQPEKFIAEFARIGINILTLQYEACPNLHRALQAVRQAGMKAGIALNPHTPVSAIEEIAVDADLILLMSVNPGFGGQKFIGNTIDKIVRTKELLLRKKSTALISVDGGITCENAPMVKAAGADVVVAGSAIFNAADPQSEIEKIKSV
jgi:ribulose-phosphate 3-epimerase